MNEKVLAIRNQFEERIAKITSSKEIEEVRIEFAGKKGFVSSLMTELKNVPNDQEMCSSISISF